MYSNDHAQNYWNLEKQNRVGGSTIGLHGKNDQVAWQYMRQKNQENRTISEGTLMNGGSRNQFSCRVKKQSSGTGVFLPRSYGTNNHINTNKSSCIATPILDRRVPGLDSNFNVMGCGVVQPPGQTCFLDDGFDSDYDVQLTKMKLFLMQKRQHIRPGSFPQQGTY
ncbi:hypothetical protein Leryth_020018 [Lithospermum erythrorhizon]|nr:hypothetical protein Leryth_020018 [Lithospermum erythrorhizon]